MHGALDDEVAVYNGDHDKRPKEALVVDRYVRGLEGVSIGVDETREGVLCICTAMRLAFSLLVILWSTWVTYPTI